MNELKQGTISGGDASNATPLPIRMFESDLLERFTRTRLATIILFWLPASAGLIILGSSNGQLAILQTGAIVVSTMFAWTLFEYAFHRFVFHLDRWMPSAKRFCFVMHGSHHVDPTDAGRNITPLVVSVPILAVLLGTAMLIFGQAGGLVFAGTFGLSYLAYDVIHYGCHQWRVRGSLASYIRRHHLSHHYVDDARHFGVTSPLWDWVLGTQRMRRRHG